MNAPADGFARYGRAEWRAITLAALTLIPFVAVRFYGVGAAPPLSRPAPSARRSSRPRSS